ncbi:aminoglycoside phosphotransferase family protein [Vibrio vulnificus]|uniref:phosphotransferase family protein n=1 Tax=Vibrio vulnificus TaxID=672 RepID=UPI001028C7D1|nr:phosphotransferase [Vibrio vulnificus]RZP73075.1 aminoglycoside phosphotransferase family protein [Vibrio vulnificus]RZP74394.1 aminoglycoside phosphotransferase family protein [Vibrio vulnificus]
MIVDLLKQYGVVKADRATATPLTGGVSCEIFLIEDGPKRYVAKRALAQLKVAEEWLADPSRNKYEQRYLKYVGETYPDWVPAILNSFEDDNLFVMEFFPERFLDWKKYLLAGELDNTVAQNIGQALGAIHAMSWGDEQAQKWFDSDKNFHELRLSPYFEFMQAKHPALSGQIEALIQKIASSKRCLVHGDFSPKNILVAGTDIKIVDCEVAWYGDPCFDIGFLLHHLLIKSLHFDDARFIELAAAFVSGYRVALGEEKYQQLSELHIVEVTLMLMLARIDGKSPVEYLSNEQKVSIRQRVCQLLDQNISSVEALFQGVKK